ncbi:MAG: NAD(P)H-dependent oxidoreductase [Microcoleaceae cyanobacterium]
MNIFIVYAHSEPKSFNGALKDLAVDLLTEKGHNVKISDLYAMKFQPVADREDFLELDNPDFFKYQIEQKIAYENGKLASDIVAEQEKLVWADFVILQFPLWWFSVPAIMKGWVDRVFTTGFAYGGGKMYDKGGLKGKKAMLSVTIGGGKPMYSKTGLNGDIEQILFPIHHGILYFVGMEVLPPFITWAPARVGDEGRQKYLEDYRQILLNLESIPSIKYRPLSDYDDEFKLKPGLES